MLLRYLKRVELKKSVIIKADNGSRTETYELIKKYDVQIQELDDEVSASIYGASLVNMLRIKTPLLTLEKLLRTKLNNKTDNISKYYIFIDGSKYKIKAVNKRGIDIELVWKK